MPGTKKSAKPTAGITVGLGVTQASPKSSKGKPTLTKARSLCSRIFNRPWKGKGDTDETRHETPATSAQGGVLALYWPPASNTAVAGSRHMLTQDRAVAGDLAAPGDQAPPLWLQFPPQA